MTTTHDPAAPAPGTASERLTAACFAVSPAVRYVAVHLGGRLSLSERPGLAGASSSESDRYEELIVNPTLLTLTRQRGNIDCGGLRYVLIRYGNFYQWVHPLRDGHVSVALEPDAPLGEAIATLERVVAEWARGDGA